MKRLLTPRRILRSFAAVVLTVVVLQVAIQLLQSSSRHYQSSEHYYNDLVLLPGGDNRTGRSDHEGRQAVYIGPLDLGPVHRGRVGEGAGSVVVPPQQVLPWTGQTLVVGGGLSLDTRCGYNVTRPKTVLHRNKIWQYYKNGTDEVIASAAFFDDRPVVGLLPWLRLHVIMRPTKKDLYCHVWYENTSHPFITQVLFNKTGRNYGIQGEKYGQSLLSCRLPGSYPIPSHVSITTSRCGNTTMYIPVEHLIRSPWQHEFGICVAIAFGSVPVTQLAEWIEFHNLYGVTEFNIYDANMENMTEVFDYYTKKGLLRVHPMPPAVNVTSYDSIKLSSPASLNDCMLRNMYRYRFILVIDFDEFLVPRMHTSYSEMLAFIDKKAKRKQPHHTYSSRNTYFFRDFPPDKSQPHYMMTAQYRTRAQPSKYGYAPKSFIDPRRCFSTFNHYCWLRFPDSGASMIDIDPKIALSHHYRKCGFKPDKCNELFKSKSQDDIALVFKHTLKHRLDVVLKKLGQL